MSYWNPFTHTVKIICPDGTTKIIYKNIDKALPIQIPEFEANIKSKFKSEYLEDASIDLELKKKVSNLLVVMDDINNDIMISFRSAYLGFVSDPCNNNKFLLNQIENINIRHHKLKTFKMQVKSFIELIKVQNKSDNHIIKTYNDIISNLGLNNPLAKELAVAQIKASKEEVKKLSGDSE